MTVGANGPRRLPLAAVPVPGESLRSLVEENARRHDVSVASVLDAAGAGRGGPHPAEFTYRLDNRPSATVVGALATVLGVEAADLASMTLQRYEGTVVRSWRGELAFHLGWGADNAGRHCPRCLADNGGRWLTSWLTPWSAVCVRHQVLLEPLCLSCGEPPRSAGQGGAYHPSPGGMRCCNRVDVRRPGQAARGAKYCNADLTQVEALQAPVTSFALLGQAHVDELLISGLPTATETSRSASGPTTDTLADLSFVARRLHWLIEPGDYPLLGLEAQAVDLWTQYREGVRRALAGRRFGADTDLPLFRVSFATCMGIAAAALNDGLCDTVVSGLAPLIARERRGGLVHNRYDPDNPHWARQSRSLYAWSGKVTSPALRCAAVRPED